MQTARGRAGLAGFTVNDGSAVSEGPEPGMAGHGKLIVDYDAAPLIAVDRKGLQYGIGASACRPHQGLSQNLAIVQHHYAGAGVTQTGVQLKHDAASCHALACVFRERLAQLWQDAFAGVHENDAQLFGAKIGIIGEDAPSKVIQCASQLDSGKATAGDYESKHGLADSWVGLAVSPLKHLDDMVPNANRIEQ